MSRQDNPEGSEPPTDQAQVRHPTGRSNADGPSTGRKSGSVRILYAVLGAATAVLSLVAAVLGVISANGGPKPPPTEGTGSQPPQTLSLPPSPTPMRTAASPPGQHDRVETSPPVAGSTFPNDDPGSWRTPDSEEIPALHEQRTVRWMPADGRLRTATVTLSGKAGNASVIMYVSGSGIHNIRQDLVRKQVSGDWCYAGHNVEAEIDYPPDLFMLERRDGNWAIHRVCESRNPSVCTLVY